MAGPLQELPSDLQRLILQHLPLLKLGKVASISKKFRMVYLDRVQERDGVVATRLKSDITAEFSERLLPAESALPRDLFADPPVRPNALLLSADLDGHRLW
jgi:hypothetical protein